MDRMDKITNGLFVGSAIFAVIGTIGTVWIWKRIYEIVDLGIK